MGGELKEFVTWIEVQRRSGKNQGIRFPEERRQWAARYARRRMEAGAAFGAVARSLAISEPTLRRWVSAAGTEPAPSERVLAPVVITDAIGAHSQRAALVVMTRGGLRIEGLDVDTAVELVRRLEP